MHVLIRLARSYTMHASRDEQYALRLLDGHADDVVADSPIALLELTRAVQRPLDHLKQRAPDLAESLHVALLGYRPHAATKTRESAWLHGALDTGFGRPIVHMESTVADLAHELTTVASALGEDDGLAEIGQLAAFYRDAALAGQVIIVGEV